MEQATNQETVVKQKAASRKTILLAGATGDLGHRIASYLVDSGAVVKAVVRKRSDNKTVKVLRNRGVIIRELDLQDQAGLEQACAGCSCVVSALSGVDEVIVHLQTKLLQAAVHAGVPRFIPSDYCIDYTKLPDGSNRNLDLRRAFNHRLDAASIGATSILNGMFTHLLTGQAPVILFRIKRVLYWGNADQPLDFTTIDNTAEYTAHAALDDNAPRYLRIAGDVQHAKGLQSIASVVTGKEFHLLRAGGPGRLQSMIRITRALFPKKKEVFPPWQGMQYLHDMFTGLPKLEPLDNHRYPGMRWTTVQEVLAKGILQ